MCSCLLEGLGCCVCACCGDTVTSCQRWLGKQRMTKICYLFIVVIFTVPAIVVLFFINKWSDFVSHFQWMTCPKSAGGGQFSCIGPSTVFRISLSFLCLFGVMLIFMLGRCAASMYINQGFFCLKYLAVLGIFIAFLFAPNQSFINYAQASQYLSIAFMVIQSIILIDLFYLAGIKLVARYDKGDTHCGAVLIILTLLFQAVAIALNIIGYIYFSSPDICGNSLWVNIVTSIILLILPFFQLLHFNPQNSLLTTSLVSLYISYLALICQYSFGSSCIGRISVNSIAADIIVSTFLFILTMYGSIMGGSGQVKLSQNANINQAMGVAPTGAQDKIGEKYQQDRKDKQPSAERLEEQPETQASSLAKYTESWAWVKWHFYMCLASIYIGMLVTNWTSASLTTGQYTSNGFGFWVRVTISWFTALLYIWTLIAPKIFPERDFTVV